MKSNMKVIIGYVLAIVLIVGVIAMIYRGTSTKTEPVTYDKVISYFQDELVREFEVSNKNKLTLTLYQVERDQDGNILTGEDGKPIYLYELDANGDIKTDKNGAAVFKTETKSYKLARVDYFHDDLGQLIQEQIQAGIIVQGEYEPAESIPAWLAYLPGIILIIVLVFLYWRAMKAMMNGAGPGGRMNSFGKSHVKLPDEKNRVTFRDVAGADEEKAELVEIVEYLKDPAKFARLGAKIPHGVLLMGPPGTGKTLLAKAVAGEAGVPFFSISGSDFVEMYVGVGASRVRDLFETARKAGNAIIFIDEIDAVGRQRGTGLGGGHDEREQTLNQLLVEMDGFGSHDGIVVIAATNRADVLDPALLRPGRFDRQISVNRPNLKGREDILKVHARNKPLEPGVDLTVVAKATVGFTGADLANLLNEAALLAARRSKSLIGMPEIEDSLNKILMGPKKKSWVMSDQEKKNTAYHEAGHAIVGYLLNLDPVHMITIVPTGKGALGFTSFRPDADRNQMYKHEYQAEIAMSLAGRAAEEIIFGDVTSGAYSDIKSATDTAKRMVTMFGMSELLGPRRFGTDQNEVFLGRDFSSNADYSQDTAAQIDREIHVLITEAYAKAKELLTTNIHKLHFIAQYLLDHEDMDGDLFKAAMDADQPTVEMLDAITEERERQSKEANEARARADEERRQREEAEKTADDESPEQDDNTGDENSDQSE